VGTIVEDSGYYKSDFYNKTEEWIKEYPELHSLRCAAEHLCQKDPKDRFSLEETITFLKERLVIASANFKNQKVEKKIDYEKCHIEEKQEDHVTSK